MNTTTTTRLRRWCGTTAAALIAAGSVLLLAAPAHAHGGEHVTISQYMYMPMSLTVDQGDTVTWTNEDTVEHNVAVTSGPTSFQSPMLAKGKSWSYTFSTAGPYSYICSVHPDMKATITVKAAAVVAPPAPATTAPATTAPAAPATSAQPKSVATAPAAAATKQGTKTGTKAGTRTGAVVPAVADTAPELVSAPQSSATLQPLLLVVGASVAAVVFCLLLMASRPIAVADGPVGFTDDEDDATTVLDEVRPKHLDES